MDIEALREYEARERAKATASLPMGVRGGVLARVEALYPDLRLGRFHGLARKGAPLGLLSLLYPKTTVFVPPMSQAKLEARLGLRWDSFIELARKQIVVPLIGHPTEYANRPHFDPLLALAPPSVWARGLALLDVLAANDLFAEAARVLPLAAMAEQYSPVVAHLWHLKDWARRARPLTSSGGR